MQMVFEILALAIFAFILGILALFLWGIVNILLDFCTLTSES